MDASVLIEILVATGAISGIAELARWLFTRGTSRVDTAKVVQGMALDMLGPLRAELKYANDEITSLRLQITAARDDLESVIQWAQAARQILDAHAITYPTLPPTLEHH